VPEAQRIVVVGGTGGLVSAVVGALLARGDRVLATGRDPERLEALRRRGAAARSLDLGDPACGAALAAAAREELGDALDGLALVAGRLEPIGPTRTVDLDALARTLDEHVLGALRVVQACAPLLDAAAAPSLVLFSGGGATGPFPRYSAYALAKVATVRLAENLAVEEPGWRVNAVAPGFVATGMHDTTLAAGRGDVGPYWEETERRLRDATPPEVAAELVAFLMSEEAAGISGRLISAVWDPWRDEAGGALLRGPTDFGRLRRIDAQRFHDLPGGPGPQR
jgi:NAD(P)-dependent dehydrogenase (short-subunit alcohol dehydrogenase family)